MKNNNNVVFYLVIKGTIYLNLYFYTVNWTLSMNWVHHDDTAVFIQLEQLLQSSTSA